MRNKQNDLGAVIKAARLEKGLTQGKLAEIIGIGERHIMGIENEGKSPSYEVLCDIVHVLNLPGDSVFFQHNHIEDSKLDQLVRLLKQCSDRDITVITALVQSMLDNKSKEL